MATVHIDVHLKVSEHEMLHFPIRKEIIENNNSLVVISVSTGGENEFMANLQSILPLFRNA